MKNLEKDSGGTVTSDMSEMYKCLLMDFVNFDGSSRGAHGESHGLFSSQMSEAFARHFWPCCTACGILVFQPGIEPGAGSESTTS